jgi:Tol biopolymer transport system component
MKLMIHPLPIVLLSSLVAAQERVARSPLPRSTLELASRGTGGEQGNSWSGGASLSSDGRFVAFHSISDDLVPGDTNESYDVFLHDRSTGTTDRVSVTTGGGEGNDSSTFPSLSSDGRFVAFESRATDLVPGDTNGVSDVFVHDRATGVTTRVSVGSAGEQGDLRSQRPTLSADGRFVSFESLAVTLAPDSNGTTQDAFVHDRATGATVLVSLGHLGQAADRNCTAVTISGDGTAVAFHTDAQNLVPDDTNGTSDVFVRRWLDGTIALASVGSSGMPGVGYSANPYLSHDGTLVAFQSSVGLVPGDSDEQHDVYVRDLAAGQTFAVSVGLPGFATATSFTSPALSADGARVAFESVTAQYPQLGRRHVHLQDRPSGLTVPLTRRADDDSSLPAISADGGLVGFETRATNLVGGDTNEAADVLVYVPYGS